MKILVIDDHALVREGLRQVLKGLDEDVVVLQAGNCDDGFTLTDTHHDLDLVLLDHHLPDMTGLAALTIFGRKHPELPILMLSGSANVQIMRQVMQAGAAGFVTKSGVSDELLYAVQQVLDGNVYMPPELLDTLDSEVVQVPPCNPSLTKRQELVLGQMLGGLSNREISESLGLSAETVKTHVKAIFRQFAVTNRTQAVLAAERAGYRFTAQPDATF